MFTWNSLGAWRQMYGPRILPQYNPSFPLMKVMTPFWELFNHSLEWCFDEAACPTSLLPCQNDIRQIKRIVPLWIPLPIQGHFLIQFLSQLRACSETFLFVLDSWRGASWSCVRLIRLWAKRINMGGICLFLPVALLPSVSSVNKET